MKRNAVEWVVLGISVVAIAIVVGALVLEGLREQGTPDPQVTLHPEQAHQGAEGWILPATIRNAGDQAAERVTIQATAQVGGAVEVSDLEVELLPAGTAVDGAFGFSAQPDGEVEVRVVSFAVP